MSCLRSGRRWVSYGYLQGCELAFSYPRGRPAEFVNAPFGKGSVIHKTLSPLVCSKSWNILFVKSQFFHSLISRSLFFNTMVISNKMPAQATRQQEPPSLNTSHSMSRQELPVTNLDNPQHRQPSYHTYYAQSIQDCVRSRRLLLCTRVLYSSAYYNSKPRPADPAE